MSETGKRTGWVDICKALAIYCMVLGHTGTSENISIMIHAFHMPVFFLLSGYCFNEEKNADIWELIRKRFNTLIIPYFVFGAGLFLLWDAALFVMHRHSEIRSISNLLTSILWNNADASAFGVIQWFLPCLFFAEIIFACLIKICKGKIFIIRGGIALLSIIAYLVPYLCDYRLPWALDCALMASFFYGLGWIVKKTQFMKPFIILNKHIFASFAAVITISAVFVPFVFFNGPVNMRTVTYGNYFLYIFNAVVYSFLLIVISMLIEFVAEGKLVLNILEWIGRNTLIVLMLNSTCVRAYGVVAGGMLDNLGDIAVYCINAVVAVLITIACVMASEFINRFCPGLVGKSKKY